MKSTIIAAGLILSLLVNTASAGDRHNVLDPLWVPVAIISTLAAVAAVAVADSTPVVYERSIRYYEPRQVVIYEEPRHRHYERDYDRGAVRYYREDHDRAYEAPRYREYR
ncbi:MAG: hypothetical protein WCP10_04565 [Desulfuromonadales bacterium]